MAMGPTVAFAPATAATWSLVCVIWPAPHPASATAPIMAPTRAATRPERFRAVRLSGRITIVTSFLAVHLAGP
jgi:hypothetical protein